MNDIILSSLLTAILGFIAFLFSQIYFKSIERYWELKARTVHALVYYGNVFHNPVDLADMPDEKLPEKYEKASDEFRMLAADWKALIELKASPGFLVPQNIKLDEVSRNLIGLSNGMQHPYNSKDTSLVNGNTQLNTEIRRLLKIH